jgi:maleylacetoacetate isomerase
MSQSHQTHTFHLYNRERSSCARRVRIALALKEVPNVKIHDLDTASKDYMTGEYCAINSRGAVPTLVVEVTSPAGLVEERFVLTQSTAMLEYLEDLFPAKIPLLPSVRNAEQRARVRELVALVSQDIFPLANRKNMNRIGEIARSEGDQVAFVKRALREGFDSYEKMLERYSGRYSVGDDLSMADVCLVPQILQAKIWGVDVLEEEETWPLIRKVVDELVKIKAFAEEMG